MRVPLLPGIGISLFLCALTAPAQTEREFQHGYRFFQNSAPEFLQIEVLEVTAEPAKGLFGGSMTKVKASARVIDVIRSDSGTPNGEVIEIRYEHAPKAGNSAETPPILEKDKSYPAFLKRTGKVFVPVARHLSFSPPSGVQMKVYEEARTRSREKALLASNPQPAAPVNIPVVVPSLLPPTAKPAPVVETEPSPSVQKATPVAEPVPAAPQTAGVEKSPAEPKAAEPAPPEPEPSKLVRDSRKVRSSKAAAAKADSELTPAAAESGPLPTNNPPQAPAPAPAPAPTPAPAAAVAAAPKNKPTPPPQPPAPQVSQVNTPKPKEEALPNIPIEAPVTQPAEPAQKPAPPPSTEGAEARKGYAEIYGLIKEGEAVQIEGKNDKAREIYTQAREKLLTLKSEQPEFQPFMVQYRIRDLEKKLEALSAPAAAKPTGSPAK